MLDGQREIRVNIDTERFEATVDAASHVDLLVSELLSNALQHAFDEDVPGEVSVRLFDEADDLLCLEVADNGHGPPEGTDWPNEGNLGARIIRDLSARLNAELKVTSSGDGTTVYIAIPKNGIIAD